MIVTCSNCGARYRIREDRLTASRARITCKKCGHKFIVSRDDGAVARSSADGLPVRVAGGGQRSFEEDDESDVPTTVMPHGSKVIRKIRESTGEIPRPESPGPMPGASESGGSPREFPSDLRAEVRPGVATRPPGEEPQGTNPMTWVLLIVFFVIVVAVATLVMSGAIPLPA